MIERLDEFENFSSEFENENSGFEETETPDNAEQAFLERTPLQKLLRTEVMVEIPNFPYSKTTPTIYELKHAEIKIEKSQDEQHRHTILVASKTSSVDLYSVGFPIHDSSERETKLKQIDNQLARDIEISENAHKRSVENIPSSYDSISRNRYLSGAEDSLLRSKSSAYDRWQSKTWAANEIPDEITNKIKFNIVKPNDGSKYSASFDVRCNRDSEYLYLPVKKWNLELFKDKEITMFVIENMEDTPESKEVWTQFLDANKHQLPMQAYILLTTKAQSLGGDIK